MNSKQKYRNRFIFYFTLITLWKSYKNHPVEELYDIIFENKKRHKGSKNLRDRLFRMEYVDLNPYSKSLDRIGVASDYYTGDKCLEIKEITEQKWTEYIELQKEKNAVQTDKYKSLRKEMILKIKDAKANMANQNQVFQDLAFFAEHKHKRSVKDVENTLDVIEKMIVGLQRRDLEYMNRKRLQQYQNALLEHCKRINALCILDEWDYGGSN